jgi:long-chain fatty acid transport protein
MASPALGFEVDINWAGWSSFDTLVIQVDSPTLPDGTPVLDDIVRPQNWDDSYNYRLGVHWNSSEANQWRFGYVYDETPQPTAGASPLLPDANRNGFSFGYGHQGSSMSFDLAVMYLPFDSKTVSGESDTYYFGEYNQTAWLVGVSLGF